MKKIEQDIIDLLFHSWKKAKEKRRIQLYCCPAITTVDTSVFRVPSAWCLH